MCQRTVRGLSTSEQRGRRGETSSKDKGDPKNWGFVDNGHSHIPRFGVCIGKFWRDIWQQLKF